MDAYDGPVRGFDLSVVSDSVFEAELKLDTRGRERWRDLPAGIVQAQKELLAGNSLPGGHRA